MLLLGALPGAKFAAAQSAAIDTAKARQYFGEARAACEQDGGRLWGISVCAPVIFVDPLTRAVAANQKDAEGILVEKDGVFIGRLPERLPVANAPVSFAGVKWAMIVWSFLTDDKFQRVKLMTHESYHRIQNELKLPVSAAVNEHLDTLEGRVWLQLEWRALQKALLSIGKARKRAIEDALTFRNYRRTLFPKAKDAENSLEMHEGIAEYTGFKLTAKDDAERIAYLTKQLEQMASRPTFVASFAYASGPAYCVLLDAADAGWRKNLSPQTNLGELLQKSLRIKLSSDLKKRAEKQAAKYDGAALRTAETGRETARLKRIAEYRNRLVDSPVLLITLTDKRSVSLNTNNVVALEGVGTVYATAKVTDDWGILDVSGGALMIREAGGRVSKIYVSAPADASAQILKGEGWTLQLNSGWTIAPGERKGDYVLKRREQ
jgi:hypothetical protein